MLFYLGLLYADQVSTLPVVLHPLSHNHAQRLYTAYYIYTENTNNFYVPIPLRLYNASFQLIQCRTINVIIFRQSFVYQ